jgi:hypothetical protein
MKPLTITRLANGLRAAMAATAKIAHHHTIRDILSVLALGSESLIAKVTHVRYNLHALT